MTTKLTPEQAEAYHSLTRLQQYTASAKIQGYNNAQAYRYACEKLNKTPANNQDTAASEILRNPQVKAFIDLVITPTREYELNDALMGREEMQAQLSMISRGNLDGLITDDKEGAERAMQRLNVNHLTRHSLTAMSQLAKLNGYDAAQKLDLSSSDGSMAPKDFNEFYPSGNEGETQS